MLSWVFALMLGAGLAYGQYRWGGELRPPRLVALRATVLAIIVALLLDAPAGPSRRVRAYAALDASLSWRASGDTTLWRRAVRSADSVGADTLLLVGDSVRASSPPPAPGDAATRVAPLVERALGAGRPVVFVTDGVVDDPDRLVDLPSGSLVVALSGASRPDAGIIAIDGPTAVVTGDTVQFTVMIAASGAGTGPGRVDLLLGDVPLVGSPLDSLAPFAQREVRLRVAVLGASGPRLLKAVLRVPGDQLAQNDTLLAVLDVAQGASAVFVSTMPDYDARYALEVLRGTLAVPTRGYFRVAPGQWRVDGALTAVTEEEVKRTLASAPLAVVHGDTALFGAPRAVTHGALALIAPPAQRSDDYYAMAAPLSPLTAVLGGLPWDSLPPVELGFAGHDAEWVGVTARRARRFDERPLLAGWTRPRRIVVVPALGLWRWRFRGGRSADAFTAFWGSVFDWMTGDATDVRAAHPAAPWVRVGESVRWRRGNARDTVATVVLRRRGAARADTIQLRFSAQGGTAESPALSAGVYDTRVGTTDGVLAVNFSAEWLPRRASVRAGAVGSAPGADRAPRARAAWWLYAIALAALCGEWLLRRRVGLR